MGPEEETGSPPRVRKRRRCMVISSDSEEEEVPLKTQKPALDGLSKEDLLAIIASLRSETGKSNPNVIPNHHNNVIPEFDPNNKSQNVDRWLGKVNECRSIYNWDEKQTIHFSLQKLTGLAKKWYESLSSLSFTWDQWQMKLRKAFPSDENYGKMLEEMLARTSRSDESLREYFYEKLTLLSRCEIIGRKAVDCIVYGISDMSVRNGAQGLRCKEPEELLSFLASQQVKTNVPHSTSTIKKRDSRSTNPGPYYRSNNMNGPTMLCFNCKERGHSFTTCPKPIVKCQKCGRVGHDYENCFRKPLLSHNTVEKKTLKIAVDSQDKLTINEVGSKPGPLSAQLLLGVDLPKSTPQSNKKFFKAITVNGVGLRAYIDFGSDSSIIRVSDAKILGLTEHFEQLPIIKGFGNSIIHPISKVTAPCKIDEVEAEIEFLVVDDQYLQMPILIGQNFTEMPSVTALKNSNELFFYFSPQSTMDATSEDDKIIKLYVCNETKVDKGGIVEVYAKENITGDVYADGNTNLYPNQEYHFHRGCYKLVNGRGFIFVSVLGCHTVSFKPDLLLARVSRTVEADIVEVNNIQSNGSREQLPLDPSEIKTGNGLNPAEKDRLYSLLQKYRSCFATNLSELGCTTLAEMRIELNDNRPVIYRPYRMSIHEREKVRNIVEELVQNDIVQESESNYASPVILVKKKTGEARLCIDFRALNSKTVKDKYPLPLIEDQIANLSGNMFFTTLDLASGYYQIPMAPESRHLTAFVTPDGLYEFKRMPFGLANAPALFQKMINKILGSKRFTSALAYMDDLLVPSVSIEEGFQRLEEVLQLLKSAGLTLKLSKCSFFDTQIEYLGYEISAHGVKPGEKKIEAVKKFPVPRNVHELRQFLGLASYFRKFVKGFGEIARPLTCLLKQDVSWKWTQSEQNAFQTLKLSLSDRPVLALYNPKLDTELHTDASSLGLGGILMQWQDNPRVLKPVAYFSRQTTTEERHFHSYELETLAVVCSLRKFRPYLLGAKFVVYTDCNAIRHTLTKRDLIPRIARWWLQISEYDFDIVYRPGSRMNHVDALSRNPATQPISSNSNADVSEFPCVLKITTENWLHTLQLADPEVLRISKILKPETDEESKEIKKNYVIKDHLVYRKVNDQLRLVVPRNSRWQICKINHDDIGHFGFSKTLERIQSQYWFPKLRNFVKKYVKACIECAYNKDSEAKTRRGHLHPIEKKDIPFHTIHLDHVGPFVKSKKGNNYILTIVDGFTKYLFARPVKDAKSKTVIKVLEGIFTDFGTPIRIISDRGTAFTSSQFKSFCASNGIRHILNAVACPRANGQAERFNQTILTALSTQNFNNDERDWDVQVGKVQWGINNTVNASTKKAPTELLFGTKLSNASENKLNSVVIDSSDIVAIDNRDELRREASDNIKISQTKQKQYFDSNRKPAKEYKEGELIKITKVCVASVAQLTGDVLKFFLEGPAASSRTRLSNNRSVMLLDVLGRTRATLKESACSPWPRGPGNPLKLLRAGDWGLQLSPINEEFLVNASHKLALITSLPFVHTARRYYRLNDLVRSSDRHAMASRPSALLGS
ncbi:unnamed protein product [Plutella xylostella]|uniref:RNA-directed DNA polymerase n=2 Tax=Plutella xylostella TaxID=51655 RepID=A0A8S4CSX4_PLUXY|nr:unnamed protein product [Plutella xylostella]